MANLENRVVLLFNWLQDHVAEVLINIVIAVVIVLIGFTAGRFIGKLLYKVLGEFEVDKLVRLKRRLSLRKIIVEVVTLAIYFATVVLALDQLGLTSTILTVLIAIVFIIIILSLFLSGLDFIPNVLGSFMLMYRKRFSVGDILEFEKIKGEVVKVNFIETQVRTKRNDLIHIPNYHLYDAKIRVTRKNGSKANM